MAQSNDSPTSEPTQSGSHQARTPEDYLGDALAAASDAAGNDDRDTVGAAMAVIEADQDTLSGGSDTVVDNEVIALVRDVGHILGTGLRTVMHGDSRPLATAYRVAVEELDAGAELEPTIAAATEVLEQRADPVETDLDLEAVLRRALQQR